MTRRTIAHYEILEKLGEGGMGEVYRARDLNLSRNVALKVINSRTLSHETARGMFRKEAVALGRLNHPNIAAVYEFNTFDGLDYLVTEYVAGATLADLLHGKALPECEIRRLGGQIAVALQAAHDNGVVHCDLKPGNVMVTNEGNVKLLDFGLARILHPTHSAAGEATTKTIIVAGTVPYMAPEQLRGDPADARMDIYAVGVLLYEIATGRRPFLDAGQANLIDAIFHQKPETPRAIQPAISASLEQAIMRCLEKEPDRRYQSAAELAKDLESSVPLSYWSKVKARSRVLTLSVLSIAATVVAIVWLVGGHAVLSFAPRDWILIADFDNQTGDPLFDRALLTAFEVSLEQSQVVNVFPRSRARDTLRRMRKSGNEPIDEILGQEIASRESIKALIVPSISGVGGEYRLAARIREVSTGADVKTRIVAAKNKEGVLRAMDKLAAGLRKDLGESLLAISGNARPLQQVTTASLEALKQFSIAVERHKATDFQEARLHYDHALNIDPQFTAARAALGMLLFEKFDKTAGADLLTQAVKEVERLTPKEKYGILAFHAAAVEHDLEKAAGYHKALLATHPDESAAHNNLGLLYAQMRRYENAVAEYKEALRIDPHLRLTLVNLSYASLFGLGDLDGVIAACKPRLADSEQDPWMLANLGWAYIAKGQLQEAETVFGRSAKQFPKFFLNRYRLGMTHRFERRWEAALRAFDEILALDPAECVAHYEIAVTRGLMGEYDAARGDLSRAQRCLEHELHKDPKDASGHMLLALVLTRLGRPVAAAAAERQGLSLDPTLQVEAAAILAASGQEEQALSRLEAAVEKGYNNFVWIMAHAEFQRLRQNPRFDQLLRSHLKAMGSLP